MSKSLWRVVLTYVVFSLKPAESAFSDEGTPSESAIVTARYSVRTGTGEIGSDDFVAEAAKNVTMTFEIRPSLNRVDDQRQDRIFEAQLVSATSEIAGEAWEYEEADLTYVFMGRYLGVGGDGVKAWFEAAAAAERSSPAPHGDDPIETAFAYMLGGNVEVEIDSYVLSD
jgi:hypothetical protein